MATKAEKCLDTKKRVIRLWSIWQKESIEQAKEEFENSKTYQVLMDPVSALWKESAAYICEKFQYELDENWEMWMR